MEDDRQMFYLVVRAVSTHVDTLGLLPGSARGDIVVGSTYQTVRTYRISL